MTSECKEEYVKQNKKKHRVNGFEEWGGYMASKKVKLSAQFDGQRHMETADQGEVETDIFKGIAIYVNGYTKPSAEELKRLMMIHGGTYHYYYSTTKTTHTIASNLANGKIKNLKNQIVVKPEWVTDSIKACKLLPYQDYLLYTPEVTHKQHTLKLDHFNDIKVASDTVELKSESSSLYNISEQVLFSNENCRKSEENTHSQNNTNNSITGNINSPSKNVGLVTSGQPGFLSEFYSHSRLHHISTAGQELKRYVQSLVDGHTKTFPGQEKLKELVRNSSMTTLQKERGTAMICDSNKKNQYMVMHLDMDCFFVSVGLKKHPELRGKPVAVTHSKGKRGGAQDGSNINFEVSHYMNQAKKKLESPTNGSLFSLDELAEAETINWPKISKYSKEYGSLSEIASCSYEARKAGIRNGMFLGEALKRCPNLITIPYDFDAYSKVSKQLYDIVASYTLDIEAVSCDELYIDCTNLLQDTGISHLQFASILREEIEQKTECTASAGLGPNMLLARLANRAAKPNGQHFVLSEHIEEFMANQKVKDLPGVGYTTSSKFEQFGIMTCGDLISWSLAKLQQEFGPKTGQALYNHCRGKDDRVVQLYKERKSVSAEINYGIRFEHVEEVNKFIKELSIEVVSRLCNINCKGKSITLKLMIRHPDAPVQAAKFMGHGVCDHISKSVVLKSATNDPTVVGNECCNLAKSLKVKPKDFRGIGIQLSKLEPVLKDTRGHKNIQNFLYSNVPNNGLEDATGKEIIAPKPLETVHKPLNKASPIKDLLSNKPSPSKQQSYYHPQPMSMEELDQSVLNALPPDLQREVLEMCENKTCTKTSNSNFQSNASTHQPTSVLSKSSKLPSKKGNHSHQTKSTKTLNKQNTLFNCIESARKLSNHREEGTTVFRKPATIGGAEDINEVRSLVKEWILSSQVVLDEDMDQFRDYILQVINQDLKKVDLILKYFHRVASTANAMWQQAYLTILSHVQQKVFQKFGTMLDARTEFPA